MYIYIYEIGTFPEIKELFDIMIFRHRCNTL